MTGKSEVGIESSGRCSWEMAFEIGKGEERRDCVQTMVVSRKPKSLSLAPSGYRDGSSKTVWRWSRYGSLLEWSHQADRAEF